VRCCLQLKATRRTIPSLRRCIRNAKRKGDQGVGRSLFMGSILEAVRPEAIGVLQHELGLDAHQCPEEWLRKARFEAGRTVCHAVPFVLPLEQEEGFKQCLHRLTSDT